MIKKKNVSAKAGSIDEQINTKNTNATTAVDFNKAQQQKRATAEEKNEDVCEGCKFETACPISHDTNREQCAMLQNMHFFMRGVDDGRRPLLNRAVIIAETEGENKGYHLLFFKKFKILNRSNIFNGQIFVDKKRDGATKRSRSLQNLLGDNIVNSVCFSAFMKFNDVWYPLDVQENARGYQYINFSILYRRKNTTDQLLLSEGTTVELLYTYFIDYRLFGSYLNRTLSYFYEDTQIVFLTRNTIDHAKLNFDFVATTLADDGRHVNRLLIGQSIVKRFLNIDEQMIIQLITDSSGVSDDLKQRLSMCYSKSASYTGTSFSLSEANKKIMKDGNTRKLELKWSSSSLFADDKNTEGTVISTVTNK